MSSGFVSGGTTDKPVERDDEWLKAQQEIEANRRKKEEEGRQEGGKSLFEILQNNKGDFAPPQKRITALPQICPFRNLDEDEVEFLDSVLESTRAKEDAVKKETAEQLNLFRRQQDEADKASLDLTGARTVASSEPGTQPETSAANSQWAINARKRKRLKDKGVLPGVKLRKSSSTSETPTGPLLGLNTTSSGVKHSHVQGSKATTDQVKGSHIGDDEDVERPQVKASLNSPKPTVGALGLSGYSSDEDA
ncbi:MAG: hypothetical protein Q9171_000700 [Xanthocarpia ochracea]